MTFTNEQKDKLVANAIAIFDWIDKKILSNLQPGTSETIAFSQIVNWKGDKAFSYCLQVSDGVVQLICNGALVAIKHKREPWSELGDKVRFEALYWFCWNWKENERIKFILTGIVSRQQERDRKIFEDFTV